MTWQRRPYVPPSRFQSGGYLRQWGVRLERNHETVNILVVSLGSWTYMKPFRKMTNLFKQCGYVLCAYGVHRYHPARITVDERQTATHYRQCMRCGCLVLFPNKPTNGS